MSAIPKTELKWLAGDELDQLDAIIREHGWTPLNKRLACALAAVDSGGNVIGFCAQNLIPHVEPLWIAAEYRGMGLAEDLVAEMVRFLYAVSAPAAYLVADNPFSERLAKLHGMELVKYPVYRKVV